VGRVRPEGFGLKPSRHHRWAPEPRPGPWGPLRRAGSSVRCWSGQAAGPVVPAPTCAPAPGAIRHRRLH